MGLFCDEEWKCLSCGFEFSAENGIYEADPNDFGTSHIVSAYYCPKCNSVKNVAICISFEKPEPGNEKFIHYDSNICEHCRTKMKLLKKKWFKIIKRKYKCPKCGKRQFQFIEESMCIT